MIDVGIYVGDPSKIAGGPALIIMLAIVAALICTVLVLMVRRRRNRRELRELGLEDKGPWWRSPNAPEDPPAPYRHREWS